MKKININNFKIEEGESVKPNTTVYNLETDEADIEKALKKATKKLGKLQNTLYAHGKYAVLICLQGMDTAGKDSLIREVFKAFNVQGIHVHSFKTPTGLELDHDFLWRHYMVLPARGKFGVFNRTHYENVLVTRVHPEYILGENIPSINKVSDIDDAFWENRFNNINNFEKHIADSGTIIFKFFLNLSKEEQKNRLLRRLDKQEKNWKFSPGDLDERKLWDSYQKYYKEAIEKTTKPHAPWYNIPADNKPTARYIVAKILLETLSKYTNIKEPELSDNVKSNISVYKNQLNNE